MLSGFSFISSPLLIGSVNHFFSALANSTSDLVKNQLSFSSYTPGYGFYGGLETVSPLESYNVRLQNGGNLVLTGTPFDSTGSIISLLEGWTHFGFPSLTSLPVSSFTSALANASKLTSGDAIKSQFKFANYIPGYGWFGTLESFEPGRGYSVRLAQGNSLTSFGASSAAGRRQRKSETIRIDVRPAQVVHFGVSQLMPATFEFSMCIVAVVVINGEVAQDGDLAAFLDGELRGIAHPSSYVAPAGPHKGQKTYNLMAYGRKGSARTVVTFQYRHADGHITDLTTNTTFAKDTLVGSADAPFIVSSRRG